MVQTPPRGGGVAGGGRGEGDASRLYEFMPSLLGITVCQECFSFSVCTSGLRCNILGLCLRLTAKKLDFHTGTVSIENFDADVNTLT